MKAGEIVYDTLRNNAGIAAIVGTRIYPVHVAQDADPPAAYYEVVLGDEIDGSLAMQPATVNVFAVATTEANAYNLAAAVDTALSGLTASDTGAWLRSLTRSARSEAREEDTNRWAVLLTYQGFFVQ